MNNYVKSKQKLDEIRSKYMCAGDIILRTAIQMVVDYGRSNFNDDSWYNDAINGVDERHDTAEAEGKILFMTRSFEKAIFECAKELAQIESYDLLIYIQKEIYFGTGKVGEPDYQRAIEIIRDCLSYLADCYGSYRLDEEEALGKFRNIGLKDEEIEYFGWEELLYYEEEE